MYERDDKGNLIEEPLRRAQAETAFKNALLSIGIKLRNDSRCRDGEYKLNTHSVRKLYSEKFSEVAYVMKHNGDLKLDSNVMALVPLDLMHTSMQTTMRYNKKFDHIKEMVCNRINLGLPVLEKYL